MPFARIYLGNDASETPLKYLVVLYYCEWNVKDICVAVSDSPYTWKKGQFLRNVQYYS